MMIGPGDDQSLEGLFIKISTALFFRYHYRESISFASERHVDLYNSADADTQLQTGAFREQVFNSCADSEAILHAPICQPT